MARIKFTTEEWGMSNDTHLQIDWNGVTLFITVNDDSIKVIASEGVEVKHDAVNSVSIFHDPHALTWNKK